MNGYPIDSMELARRAEDYREGTPEFFHLVQRCIPASSAALRLSEDGAYT
ncbi:MAG: hypothetical protein JWR63_1753 [Conexibacter sp.]|nr:hypothetical protein [Conexibacter sp.]